MLSRYALVCLLFIVPASASVGQGQSVTKPAPPPLGLGPVPRNCPGAARTVVLKGVFGTGVNSTGAGAFPVWGSFGGPRATLAFGAQADVPGVFQAPYGWGHKLLWALDPRFKGRVTLQGGSLHGHARLWFGVVEKGAPDTLVRVVSLDARRQKAYSGGAGAWPEFPSGLYVPRAGCYYLQARWPGGTWRMIFAAGR